jgi:hypothetical protein
MQCPKEKEQNDKQRSTKYYTGFNTIFNNISVTSISWWLVLLVEETGGPGENHRPVASH